MAVSFVVGAKLKLRRGDFTTILSQLGTPNLQKATTQELVPGKLTLTEELDIAARQDLNLGSKGKQRWVGG